jgi:hypothetical protein
VDVGILGMMAFNAAKLFLGLAVSVVDATALTAHL